MPFVRVRGANLNYVDTQAGDETILFSHGFLMSQALFAPQIEALKPRYRCVAYDHRGQAGSEVTKTGYDLDSLTEDAEAVIGALDLGPCHFVGLSMGGFVGMRLALKRPDLIRSLILLDTSADPETNKMKYSALGLVARVFGLRSVAGPAMNTLFGTSYLSDPAQASARTAWRTHVTDHDKAGILRALKALIDRDGVAENLVQIDTPTLVLTGEEDVATPPEKGRKIAAAIPGAIFKLIDKAGHSATIEQPQAVTSAIAEFLETSKNLR